MTLEDKNFLTLCKKARLASSLAKLQGCHDVYDWKADYLSQLITKFPDRIVLLSYEFDVYRINLVGFGEIHLKTHELSKSAKKIIYI